MSQRRSSLLATIVAAALAMAGCSRLPIYSHFEAVDQQGWNRSDTLRFIVPVSQAGIYSLRLHLRTNSLYPYTQLTLTTRAQASRSHIDSDGQQRIDITDDEGYTNGRGTGVFQYLTIMPPLTLAKNDTLRVAVSHGMHREVLPGIVDVGLTVKAAE